jgi:hypothetical protein
MVDPRLLDPCMVDRHLPDPSMLGPRMVDLSMADSSMVGRHTRIVGPSMADPSTARLWWTRIWWTRIWLSWTRLRSAHLWGNAALVTGRPALGSKGNGAVADAVPSAALKRK